MSAHADDFRVSSMEKRAARAIFNRGMAPEGSIHVELVGRTLRRRWSVVSEWILQELHRGEEALEVWRHDAGEASGRFVESTMRCLIYLSSGTATSKIGLVFGDAYNKVLVP